MKIATIACIFAALATSAAATGTYEPPAPPMNVSKNENTNSNRQQQFQGQRQGQAQSNRNRVAIDNSSRSAASSAVTGNVAGCMEGSSASIQTFGWGVGVAKCRGDYYNQVVDAEQRALRGHRAGAIYLSTRDKGAHTAFRSMGVIETTNDRRARVGVPVRVSCPSSDPILTQDPRTGAYRCHRPR